MHYDFILKVGDRYLLLGRWFTFANTTCQVIMNQKLIVEEECRLESSSGYRSRTCEAKVTPGYGNKQQYVLNPSKL